MKKNYFNEFIKKLNEEVEEAAKDEGDSQLNQETQDENLEWIFDEIFVSEEFREAVKKIYNIINEKVKNIGKEIDTELSSKNSDEETEKSSEAEEASEDEEEASEDEEEASEDEEEASEDEEEASEED